MDEIEFVDYVPPERDTMQKAIKSILERKRLEVRYERSRREASGTRKDHQQQQLRSARPRTLNQRPSRIVSAATTVVVVVI